MTRTPGQASFAFGKPSHGGYREQPTYAQRRFVHVEVMLSAGKFTDGTCALCLGEPGPCEWCGGTGKFSDAQRRNLERAAP